MEEKNNALEKSENIVKENQKKNNAKKGDNDKNYKNAKQRIKAHQKEIEDRTKETKKEDKEKAMAEKRIEKARIKAHLKAEKEKARATRIREKNRRKAELKKRKAEIKAEKIARREKLKHESKKDREKRILLEKQARHDKRIKLHAFKVKKHENKLAERRLKRENRTKERQKNKERRKGVGGYVTAVITLSICTLVLASVLTFVFLMPSANDNNLEAGYQKSFYDTVEQVDNIDLNLSKILATKDNCAKQKYLVNTAINSELCENDLQQLPLKDESKFYTTKLINQIGDYSKYLNNKLVDGKDITDKELNSLRELYKANLQFKEALQRIIDGMGDDYSFTKMLENSDDIVIKNFNELQNLSVEYPELIYDGPFSDGQDKREIKGLNGKEITDTEAKEFFIRIFKDYKPVNVEVVGECHGDMDCYDVQADSDGEKIYAQLSVKGGHLIMFDMAGDCCKLNIDKEQAIEKGKAFIESLNIKDMKAVWVNLANNVFTINYAYEKSDVVIYSDLIKVRVCGTTGKVIGMEAKSYFTNHTERVINPAEITSYDAEMKLFDGMEVIASRLALVPTGLNSERLCYEFYGEADGETYYVYIDAITGRQVEMFKVIRSSEGTFLM